MEVGRGAGSPGPAPRGLMLTNIARAKMKYVAKILAIAIVLAVVILLHPSARHFEKNATPIAVTPPATPAEPYGADPAGSALIDQPVAVTRPVPSPVQAASFG